jgi:hypothetical protein
MIKGAQTKEPKDFSKPQKITNMMIDTIRTTKKQ